MTRFRFSPLAAADLPMLYDWMGRSHWTRWWGERPPFADVEAQYGAWIADPAMVQPYIVGLNQRPFAYLQSYVVKGAGGGWWEDETDPGARGIDQSIADAADLGRGLGTAMVKAFLERLFSDPQVTRIQTDPAPDNLRAIRCYEKAGFRKAGEVVTPDGRALLMICERAHADRQRRPGSAPPGDPAQTPL